MYENLIFKKKQCIEKSVFNGQDQCFFLKKHLFYFILFMTNFKCIFSYLHQILIQHTL